MKRSIRPDAVLVQAVIAGALSFAHLHDLAQAAGQTGWKAWAYPISVDLLLVAAWRRLRAQRSRLAWCWFLIALVASLGANIATAGFLDMEHPPALLRLGVAGWPALAFLGGTLLAHQHTEPAPDSAPPSDPEPVPEPRAVVEVDRPQAPELAPEISEPEPVPALPKVAVSVPPALIDHARKVATEHRARTGAEIDVTTLRTRLGLPEDLAGAIVAQLA
ncbi:DUF2637 domain-containing protein [Streptomyces sp. CRPSP2-6A1]|uniref:DUF2637 domain-containing protein n=1 Tax=Streptomyces sp. CRPSP2-6A1 TaxID=2799588 RepID=UPI0018F0CCBB|nr:DUF2637 domain-containing protein [Streptomyces sp. CRPSP2-6A1]MBJ7001723.1 DUF2637 domain-containing protein [Streptomyces sp. CRPSP2-6A1]